MSTSCSIAYEFEDGHIEVIQCHHDGYVSGGVGEMLHLNYRNPKKIEVLFRKGDIFKLGTIPYSKLEYWDDDYLKEHQSNADEMTVAYVDRGDDPTNSAPFVLQDEEAYLLRFHNGIEQMYSYIYRKGEWYIVDESIMPKSDYEKFFAKNDTLDNTNALSLLSDVF